MKKLLIILSVVSCTASLFALNYLPGQCSTDPKEGKWSTCVWGSNINFDTTNLPQKPGPNDSVIVRSGWTFEIDQDINIRSLAIISSQDVYAKKKTIKLKGGLGGQIPAGNRDARLSFESCTVENGGTFPITFWHEARGAGRIEFSFTDSKVTNKSDLSCIVPINPIVTLDETAGVIMTMKGNTQFLVGGGATIDSLFEDTASSWFFRWNFEGKDGKFPYVYFNKRAEFKNCEVNIKVGDKAKVGKYTLAEFYDRKSGFINAKFTLNGNTYNLGEVVKIKDKKVSVNIAPSPTGKDKKTPNDLVLDIAK